MVTALANVHVLDDSGISHQFLAGDEVPAWAVRKIRNPDVLGEPVPATDRTATQEDAATAPPPQSGRGAARTNWLDYAATANVTVDAEATRDEIIDACREAGVSVE